MNNLRKIIRKTVEKAQQNTKDVFLKFFRSQTQYSLKSNKDKQNKTQSPTKQIKSFKINRMKYPQLDKFFIRFFNSKPIQGRLNDKSLAFVIGAQNVGKSQYIKKNIQQIKKRKNQMLSQFNNSNKFKKQPVFDVTKSPEYLQNQIKQNIFDNQYYIMININYKQSYGLNFKGFVEDLHERIFKEIHQLLIKFEEKSQKINKFKGKSQQNQKIKKQYLLNPQIIKNIVDHQNAPQYTFIFIKDVIYSILQDKDQIFIKDKTKLQQFNDKIAGQSCEKFFNEYYSQLIEILSEQLRQQNQLTDKSEQFQQTYIALKLFYSVFSRIQHQYRPIQYINSWYQSGIQTTNYLFDILNFLTGTGKYLQFIQKEYISAQTQVSKRQQLRQYLQNSNNFILKGNHIDTMITMSNIDQLYCFQNKNQQFIDFIDHLICRTVNENNFRKHFPIMIQIPNRQFLDQLLQLGKLHGDNPIVVQIPGYHQKLLKFSNIVQAFEVTFLQKNFINLGRNTHTWNTAIELMAKGESLQRILQVECKQQQKYKIIAQAKLNRVYIDKQVLPMINSGQLDYYMIQCLHLYSKIRGMGITQYSFYSKILFKLPHFQSMLSQNIFYHHFYLPYIQYQNVPVYLSTYQSYYKHLQSNNSMIKYKLWKYFNREYSLIHKQLEYTKKNQILYYQIQVFGKDHVDQEFWETYYGPDWEYKYQYKEKAYGFAIFN